MPQFDLTALLASVTNLVACSTIYYYFVSIKLFSDVVALFKFRSKTSRGTKKMFQNALLPANAAHKKNFSGL